MASRRPPGHLRRGVADATRGRPSSSYVCSTHDAQSPDLSAAVRKCEKVGFNGRLVEIILNSSETK